MEKIAPILKDEDHELPVPHAWRGPLREIVELIRDRKADAAITPSGIEPITEEDMASFSTYIGRYGEGDLISLPQKTWETSVYRWMKGYWIVLVDLFLEGDIRSDMVLFVTILEHGQSYRFRVDSLHVP